MRYYPDVMRNRHLGMDAYFLGGVLKVMLQYAPLRETMFLGKRGDYPKLKGKAAKVRSMTQALLVAWRRLREAHGLRSTYAEQIELGLQCSKDTHQSSPARVCAVAFAIAQAHRPCQPARTST